MFTEMMMSAGGGGGSITTYDFLYQADNAGFSFNVTIDPTKMYYFRAKNGYGTNNSTVKFHIEKGGTSPVMDEEDIQSYSMSYTMSGATLTISSSGLVGYMGFVYS